jgi:hypothetical protein
MLVPTFCEIVKNGSYVLKIVGKNPINFSIIKNGLFRLFVDPTILILVHTFCKIEKNIPYILKNRNFQIVEFYI